MKRQSLVVLSPSLFAQFRSRLATVRECEGNLKRYSGRRMTQGSLRAVLLHSEQGFKTVKEYAVIKTVVAAIETEQAESRQLRSAACNSGTSHFRNFN